MINYHLFVSLATQFSHAKRAYCTSCFLSTEKENETERCTAWACFQSGKRGRRQKGDVRRFEKNRSLSFHQYLEEECAWPRSSSG